MHIFFVNRIVKLNRCLDWLTLATYRTWSTVVLLLDPLLLDKLVRKSRVSFSWGLTLDSSFPFCWTAMFWRSSNIPRDELCWEPHVLGKIYTSILQQNSRFMIPCSLERVISVLVFGGQVGKSSANHLLQYFGGHKIFHRLNQITNLIFLERSGCLVSDGFYRSRFWLL